MKLLRFGPPGAEKPGLLDEGGTLRDLSGVVDDIAGATLSPEGLEALRALDPAALPEAPGDSRIGPCVGRVGKLIGIGLNYSDHAAESGLPVPDEPIVFLKATSAIAGPYDSLHLPPEATQTDWEVELACVIGTRAQRVTFDAAMGHVAGYCICNDISERGWQTARQGQWTKGKSHDGFAPLGPWLVTADAVPDPEDLRLRLDLNGQRRQDGTSATMIFGIAHLVSYLSHFMTLHPGDVITTGTPPGVGMGMKPPHYLKSGDVIRLEIDGLGHQQQIVEQTDR